MSIAAQITPSDVAPSSRLLHRYAAGLQLLELITQYDASGSDEDRALVVDLSLAASVISPFTAFVGLRPKDLGKREKVSVKIPLGIKKHMSVDYLDGLPFRSTPTPDSKLKGSSRFFAQIVYLNGSIVGISLNAVLEVRIGQTLNYLGFYLFRLQIGSLK